MAKTTPLSPSLLETEKEPLPQRSLETDKKTTTSNDALIQIRCTKTQRRAIKATALALDMNTSEFMLLCFNAYIKNNK
jgi:hypothetical protein